MKKIVTLGVFLAVFLVFISLGSASSSDKCSLKISLYNQDPYPAVQGEYVKLVFKIEGLEEPDCKDVYFELSPDFPIRFDSGANRSLILKSGSFLSDYGNFALVPFNVIIDNNAIDKDYEIKVRYAQRYTSQNSLFITQKFNVSIQESKTDFEVTMKDYDFVNQIATFDIINVGKKNVKSLVVDMSNQEHFSVKGSSRNIVGSLDSNDDTSFTFEGIPSNGPIDLKLSYNDDIGIRRKVDKQVVYDSSMFTDRVKNIQKPNYTTPIVIAIILVIIVYVIVSRILRKRKLDRMRNLKR